MVFRRFTFLIALVMLQVCNPAYCDQTRQQASEFFKSFSRLCLENRNDFEVLRKRFNDTGYTKLQSDQARFLLGDEPGDAWIVSAKENKVDFALAMHTNQKDCSLFVRSIDQIEVERTFDQGISEIPMPYGGRQTGHSDGAPGGLRSVIYELTKNGAPQSMVHLLIDVRNDKETHARAIISIYEPPPKLSSEAAQKWKDAMAKPIAFSKPSSELNDDDASLGKIIYAKSCNLCHGTGIAMAPKLGDKSNWSARLRKGSDTLYVNAIKGFGAHPPKAADLNLSDDEIRAATYYMIRAVTDE